MIAPTQADRMTLAYPEIQSGRLLILADFEDEKQMQLFRLESATNPGRLTRDPQGGRVETGTSALAVTLEAPHESLVVSSPREGDWFLKRDWRPYDLLMMAIRSPAAGRAIEIKIVGGVSGQAVQARTPVTLEAGWNHLRFDLAEVGEQVPLDDIQEIRLSLVDIPAEALTLHIDDLLLAGNRRDLMGDSANTNGGLYVQSAGRHWNVGAGGRFEISFRNGQITRWYNLESDPYRLRNLVRGTALGPVPVTIEGSAARTTPSFAESVAARQRILEMNSVRVVVECLWGPASQSGQEAIAAFDHWIYTVYGTGQVYVSMDSAGMAGADVAINMAWSPEAPEVVISGGQSAAGGLPAYAVLRSHASDAALLFVPHPNGPVTLQKFDDAPNKVSTIVWNGSGPSKRRAHLWLGSSGQLSADQAAARAVEFATPGALRMDIGRPASALCLRADGWDPGAGCFHLRTEGNRARWTIEGQKRAAFDPVFCVDGQTTDPVWVYVNYLLHQPVVRLPGGHALFQVRGTIEKPIVVEPLFKKGEESGG